jgi:hypothetical protein
MTGWQKRRHRKPDLLHAVFVIVGSSDNGVATGASGGSANWLGRRIEGEGRNPYELDANASLEVAHYPG